jgi:hypothetical protein
VSLLHTHCWDKISFFTTILMRDLFFGFGEFVGLVDVFRVLISYLGLVFPDCTVMVWVLLGCFFLSKYHRRIYSSSRHQYLYFSIEITCIALTLGDMIVV